MLGREVLTDESEVTALDIPVLVEPLSELRLESTLVEALEVP